MMTLGFTEGRYSQREAQPSPQPDLNEDSHHDFAHLAPTACSAKR